MTLSDAARTGRKFRRTSEPDIWYRLVEKEIVRFNPSGSGHGWTFDADNLVAMDWEPEPVKVQVSKQDLIDCARAISKNPITSQRRLSPMEYAHLFIEQLGL